MEEPNNVNFENGCAETVMIEHYPSCSLKKVKSSKEEFHKKLSMLGGHFLSIKICHGNDNILEKIRDSCKDVRSMELYGFPTPPHLQGLRNLKELEIGSCRMCIDELRNYFASNPDLEILKYDKADEDFMKLLQLLPKLKSLWIQWTCDWINPNQIQHLLLLQDLTTLSFSCENCKNFLIQIATKLSLVELQLYVNIEEDIFDIITLFQNLEILSILNTSLVPESLPEAICFPSKLKRIKLRNISSYSITLLAIIKELEFLEEIDLCRVNILCDRAHQQSKIIPRIIEERKFNERVLTIIYPSLSRNKDARLYLYNSKSLKIVCESYFFEQNMDECRSGIVLKLFYHHHHHDYDDDCSSQDSSSSY